MTTTHNNHTVQRLIEIRTHLNYYRRIERRLIKTLQKACPHHKVKKVTKMAGLPPLTTHNLQHPPCALPVYYKVICDDCGKVLSK